MYGVTTCAEIVEKYTCRKMCAHNDIKQKTHHNSIIDEITTTMHNY